ncbi:MAG: FAD-dependent oxidoreductase [Akkermansiaceae bacterium]|nr:FAD-dependent oxidoreductase [Akkermansiaceae bacterium]
MILILALPTLLLLGASRLSAADPHLVLVECEGFASHGGWVLDQQFMDQMGSPYLLAHGLGRPVADATTTVRVTAPGSYRAWVRTKDWVAPWKTPGSPGRFQLMIDGKPLDTAFGTEGADWHWQDGGTVDLAGETKLALHDLTGFEGRCDAILFSSDPAYRPPNAVTEMAPWRLKLLGLPDAPEDGGSHDLVVVGGGIAGTCAALSAARLGLDVVLVQDRPVLGGNNSSEVRVWLNGNTCFPPYPQIGAVVKELEPAKRAHYGDSNSADKYEDERRLALVRSQANLALLTEYRVNQVTATKHRITGVVAQHTRSGRRLDLRARWFVDATGDGEVGARAGADFDMTMEGHMGASNLWYPQLDCGCDDKDAINSALADTGRPSPFPRCPWAVDLTDKPFPGRKGGKGLQSLGVWYWESGFDRHPIDETELMRDQNLRAMYGAWDALKNVDGLYPNHQLGWAAFIAGKRESRRLLGDLIATEEDFRKAVPYPDGSVPCTWPIDLHLPDAKFRAANGDDAFLSSATTSKEYHYAGPYWLPYRCLYSRNVDNLFMAGRDFSVTHQALGPVRVMRTCGMMGEVVGMAAAVCKRHDTTPRGVYQDHLAELQTLMKEGTG